MARGEGYGKDQSEIVISVIVVISIVNSVVIIVPVQIRNEFVDRLEGVIEPRQDLDVTLLKLFVQILKRDNFYVAHPVTNGGAFVYISME